MSLDNCLNCEKTRVLYIADCIECEKKIHEDDPLNWKIATLVSIQLQIEELDKKMDNLESKLDDIIRFMKP